VVSFTLRPLYPQGKSRRYPLDRRLGGPQSRSGRRGEEKILDPTGTRNSDPLVVQPVASHYTDRAIPAKGYEKLVMTEGKLKGLVRTGLEIRATRGGGLTISGFVGFGVVTVLSSGIYITVVCWKPTSGSQEPVTFVIRVQ
jgi:hypothetical protein